MSRAACAICFCDTPADHQVACLDVACRACCCRDCFGDYVSYCHGADALPVCMGGGCGEWYLYSTVERHLQPAQRAKYVATVLKCTLRQEGAVVDAKLASEQMIATLRKERLAFLDGHFTKAIQLVVRVAFAHRMKRIARSRTEKIQQSTHKQGRRACMTLLCKGFLDPENFTCMLCRTAFCQSCERFKEDKHACDPNDVASVTMLRQMVRCPQCKTRVERVSGCPSMTCAVCSTHFDYRTGDFGGHGSQNAPVAIVERSTLSGTYRDRVDAAVLDWLLRFEARKPKEPSKQPFMTTLLHIKSGKLGEVRGALTLCKQIEQYKRLQYRNRCYYQLAQRIEEELKKGSIDRALVQALAVRA